MKTLHWDEIDPATGQPYTWDDPNIRWGDPSYVLEPGDPDYTPTVPVNQPPTQLKKMKRQAYYPSRAADQIVWLENFRNKLPGYKAALGLSDPQAAAGVADARALIYVLGSWLPAVRNYAPACTTAANDAMTGDGQSLLVLPVFTPPALPSGVTMVNSGALDRIFALVATIKDSSGFTEAIGTDLGVIGAGTTAPDLNTVQPVLGAKVNGTRVDITWNWGGNAAHLDMLELCVDRGDGQGWRPLAHDTTPNYTDTAPFPAVLTRWKYKAIYHVDDAPVGLWSAEVSVTVGG